MALLEAVSKSSAGRKGRVVSFAAVLLAAILPFFISGFSLTGRIASIVAVCILLWLLELVPPFVPTLLLWVLIPLFLSESDPKYSLPNTLQWAADPVLALFFGGFALAAATERHGLDKKLAAWAFARAGNSFSLALLTAIGLTAFMSMWISNIAAAALMFSCLRPLLSQLETADEIRRALLVGTAVGANLGGIATPIGTGPNAIALAHTANQHHITFIDWMVFAVPLTAALLCLGFAWLWYRTRNVGKDNWKSKVDHAFEVSPSEEAKHDMRLGQISLLCILGISIALWLTEPVHGVAAAVVAVAASASLFLFQLLKKEDLARIDWSTLLLIAGGITIGKLLESSGMISSAAGKLALGQLDPTVAIFILCFASALLSALMSNTATAVLLIPIASAFMPEPSTAILIAVSASFGMPFIISTPPNAMAYGEGARAADLLYPGLVIMFVGCILVSLTGRAVLNFAGIP
jgi:solute carrier family 13 (sodium-dependent dicarboxylate transporter), member 2/3/5